MIKEYLISKISLKIISGGMEDDIEFGLINRTTMTQTGDLRPGVVSDSIGYNCQTGILKVQLFFNFIRQI